MGWFSNDTDSDKATDTENRNNADYASGYEAGRDGTGGVYATGAFFFGENASERAGRQDGEADYAKYGSRK